MEKKHNSYWKRWVAFMLVLTMTFTSFDVHVLASAVESAVVTDSSEETTESSMEDGTTEQGTENTSGETSTDEINEDSAGMTETESSESSEDETADTAEMTDEDSVEESDEVSEEEQTETEELLPVEEEETILYEEKTERTEESKTFRLSNGSFMVAQYGIPVHYKDENGEWQDIDTSLSADGEEYTTNEKDGKTARIKFSKKLKEGKTVSIKNSEYPISWGLSGAEKKTVTVIRTETEEKKGNERFLILGGLTQKVRYEDIYENVDVEYILQSEGIKENIVLKKEGTPNVYQTVYNIGKLKAVQKDSQTISLMSGEKEIYQIQAPYMVDAVGEMSEALEISFEETKNKEITVTVIAEEAWLTAEERVYPVTIDPYVLTETTRDDIDTTFITKDLPNANYSEKKELLVGRESSSYGLCRTLVKINLPSLNAGDMVVDAKLRLYLYKSDFYASSTPDLPINAYQVTSSWDASTVTWNTAPSYNSTVLDYAYINRQSSSDAAVAKIFDITKAAKSWYEGASTNYGIIITSAKESGTYAQAGVKGYFWPERYNTISNAYPLIQITYRNNKGLEDYWTYTGLSAGSAGTAYINDYTGNLVFVHSDVSTTGEILPASLQHVYNGYMHKKDYSSNYPKDGYGWKTTYQQTLLSSSSYGLTGDALEQFPYAYEDGDGTVHYFYKQTEDGTTKYVDEDGLGLELTISGSTKTITDKKDNKLIFDSYGNLTTIKDATGNQITITYSTASDGKRIIGTIKDGAGHVITLTNSSNQLSKITDPEGRITQYIYSTSSTTVSSGGAPGAGYLIQIKYPDGNSSYYAYDSDGALIKATAKDGSGLTFTYTTEAKGKRISKVVEFATDGTTGQTISFSRNNVNQTEIRTAGSDDTYGNGDDLITTMGFDDFGRTKSTVTKTQDGAELEYGGTIYSYSGGSGEVSGNIKSINRVTNEAYSGRNIRNYLSDHGAELNSGWSSSSWNGGSTADVAERTNSERLYGQYSWKLGFNSIPATGGACYSQAVSISNVIPGKTYTLSGYIKTSEIETGDGTESNAGACLALLVTNADGSYSRYYSDSITGTSLTDINDGWKRVSVTVTIPTGATAVKACMVLQKAKGTAWFDGLQLEAGESANAYNLLENAHFEVTTSTNMPKSWSNNNAASTDGSYVLDSAAWGNSIKLAGDIETEKQIWQEVAVSGTEGDIYVASAWSKANAVDDTDDRDSAYQIYVKVCYSDGTSVVKEQTAEFNRDYTGWQKASVAFDLSDGTDTVKVPVKIIFAMCYYRQANTAYFDNAQLVKDIWGSYTYDEEGNLIKTVENGEKSSAFTYNSNNDLTQVKDGENRLYNYTYNDAHQVTEAKTPDWQKIQFTYNSTGSVISSAISNSGVTTKIRTLYEYTEAEDGIAAGAYLAKETDDMGYSTTYDRDIQSGRLKSVTTPDGTVTSYTYKDGTDLLTGVSSGGSSVSYTYDSKNTRLEEISRNGMTYSFIYDVFGNVIKTSVGDSVLSTNTYAGQNGKLTEIEYGNGDTKEYSYDRAGNVASVSVNGEESYVWTYDASQVLTEYEDKESGREHTYGYDITGRLSDVRVRDADSGDVLLQAEYSYNNVDEPEKEQLTAGGRTLTNSYTYNKNGQLASMTHGDITKTYTYDILGRMYKKNIPTTTPIQYNYVYYMSNQASEDGVAFRTTRLDRELLGNQVYSYTYDSMGNITAIYSGNRVSGTDIDVENSSLLVSYQYDSLGQLIRENSVLLGKTIVYTYDAGGNLTSKKIYSYTTSADVSSLTPADTITYTYDTDWTDKLVSYDGQSITYDAIGNPLSYRGKTMDWEGRQLVSLTGTNLNVSYTYDADGIRTTKTVNGTVIQYFYSGGQLVYEERGSEGLHYLYDTYGNLAAIYYYDADGDEEVYHVVVNSRGDVEALYDSAGALKVRYQYDSWGKMVSVQDGAGNEITDAGNIGLINPIRYRGYYYDAETGWYYVSSRYYDPGVGRFISADGAISGIGGDIRGYNLYSYCMNNPVNMSDPNGNWPKWVQKIGNTVKSAVKSVVNAVKKVANTVKTTVAKFAKKTSGVSNKRPPTGEPGSTYVAPNGDRRTYGPDGKPVHDYDHSDHGNPKNHPHDENGGHHHDWDWTKNPPRQGPYIPTIEQIAGVGLVTISSIGIAVVALDNLTGVGIADDFLYGPLGVGVSQGLIMIY